MKAVLISIQPKWCELIARGKKTVEVRKTRPKIETPFKVYIYCTKAKEVLLDVIKDGDNVFGNTHHGKTSFIKGTDGSVCDMYGKRQKVIGEFVCDEIDTVMSVDTPCMQYFTVNDKMDMFFSDVSCLDVDEAGTYLGFNKEGYGWHISDLVIYDEPKELSEFMRFCDGVGGNIGCRGCEYYYTESNESVGFYEECGCDNLRPLKRPPQSWCFVEEVR